VKKYLSISVLRDSRNAIHGFTPGGNSQTKNGITKKATSTHQPFMDFWIMGRRIPKGCMRKPVLPRNDPIDTVLPKGKLKSFHLGSR